MQHRGPTNRVPPGRQLSASLLGGLLLVVIAAQPAASPPTAAVVAAHPTPVTLPGTAYTGTVADLTGDGARELVRLVPDEDDAVALEVWRFEGTGWSPLPPVPVHIVGADGTERQLRARDAARFVVWRNGAEEQLLLASLAGHPDRCCLTIHRVDVEAGVSQLTRLPTPVLGARELHTADVDASGVEELLILGATGAEPEQLHVLAWDGSHFEVAGMLELPEQRSAATVVDTDGLPGDELLLFGRMPAPTTGGRAWLLLRITDREGELHREQSATPVFGSALMQAIPGVDRLILSGVDGGTHLVDWPADGRLRSEARSPVRGQVIGVLGRAGAGRVLLLEGSFLSDTPDPLSALRVLDAGLASIRGIGATEPAIVSRAVSRALERGDGPWPYIGPLPGGMPDGRAAFIVNGQLVAELVVPESCDGDCVSVRGVVPLAGSRPLGVAGPDGGWLALTRSHRPVSDVGLRGGPLVSPMPAPEAWTVARIGQVLAAQAGDDLVSVAYPEAVAHPRRPGLLAVRDTRLLAEVVAPPGARVYTMVGEAAAGPHLVGAAGSLELTIPLGVEGGDPIPLRTLVTTTGGAARVDTRHVVLAARPPPLSVEVGPHAFSTRIPISGRTNATVVSLHVDGEPQRPDREGRFESVVEVGLWPRRVDVEVVDILGQRTVERLTLIGLIDHRDLPWPLLVGTLTAAAAALWVLRAPRRTRPVQEPGAALEELADDER